jgi:DNA-binding PadR family transcriptional regulator
LTTAGTHANNVGIDMALGEFELMVLLAVARLEQAASAMPIRDEIVRRTDRTVARGAIYVTLDRLVRKGLLRAHQAEAGPNRGGRPSRIYWLTASGLAATKDSIIALRKMQRGLSLATHL